MIDRHDNTTNSGDNKSNNKKMKDYKKKNNNIYNEESSEYHSSATPKTPSSSSSAAAAAIFLGTNNINSENDESAISPDIDNSSARHEREDKIEESKDSRKKFSKNSESYLKYLTNKITNTEEKLNGLKKRQEKLTSMYIQMMDQYNYEDNAKNASDNLNAKNIDIINRRQNSRDTVFNNFNDETKKIHKKITNYQRALPKLYEEKERIEKTGRITNTRQILDGFTNRFFAARKNRQNQSMSSLSATNSENNNNINDNNNNNNNNNYSNNNNNNGNNSSNTVIIDNRVENCSNFTRNQFKTSSIRDNDNSSNVINDNISDISNTFDSIKEPNVFNNDTNNKNNDKQQLRIEDNDINSINTIDIDRNNVRIMKSLNFDVNQEYYKNANNNNYSSSMFRENAMKSQNTNISVSDSKLDIKDDNLFNAQHADSKDSLLSSKSNSLGELRRHLASRFKEFTLAKSPIIEDNSLMSQSDSGGHKDQQSQSLNCASNAKFDVSDHSNFQTFQIMTNILENLETKVEDLDLKIRVLSTNINQKLDSSVDNLRESIDQKIEQCLQNTVDNHYSIEDVRKALESLDYRSAKFEQQVSNLSKSDSYRNNGNSDESICQKLAIKFANIVVQIITIFVMLFSSFSDAIIDLDSRFKTVVLFMIFFYLLVESIKSMIGNALKYI